MKPKVRRFAARVLLFWTPVAACLGLFEAILWTSGETWPVGKVVGYQRSHPDALFLRGALGQAFQPYKLQAVAALRPRVIALGSSRVMQFRARMFGEESFFNAGGMIQDVDDLESFLDLLPRAAMPKVVLLGVDLWWFNGSVATPPSDLVTDPARSWSAHLSLIQKMVRRPELMGEMIAALRAGPGAAIGSSARLSGSGFRSDGSMYMKLALPPSPEQWRFVDREVPPVPVRIRRAMMQFQPAKRIGTGQLRRFEDALDRFRARGVQVIGFAPPLSAEAVALLDSDLRHRGLWRDFKRTMPAVFARRDFAWLDASSTAELGIDDRYLFDGLHGGETLQLYLLRQMLRDARVAAALPAAAPAVEFCLRGNGNFWYLGSEVARASLR